MLMYREQHYYSGLVPETYLNVVEKYCSSSGRIGRYISFTEAIRSYTIDATCKAVYDEICDITGIYTGCSVSAGINESSLGTCVYVANGNLFNSKHTV